MPEEGEIGEEGEIVAAGPTDPAAAGNTNNPQPQSSNVRPPFRRNSTSAVPGTNTTNPIFREQGGFRGGGRGGGRFPGRGGRGGRGRGRGGVNRHHTWTAGGQGKTGGDPQQGVSRWGPSNPNEQPRRDSIPTGGGPPLASSPLQRNPSFVGSSSSTVPPRKPSFARVESTGSVGAPQQQRSFPPTPPFSRNESFGARPNELRNELPFRGNQNDGFPNTPPTFSRQDSFSRSNEQRNEPPFRGNSNMNEGGYRNPPAFSRNESFGRSNEPPPPRIEAPFRGNANEGYGPPTPTFSRNESFGARQNEQPRNEPFRGVNTSANEGFQARDAFGRLERTRSEDTFGRQPQQQQQRPEKPPPPPPEMHPMPRPAQAPERIPPVAAPPFPPNLPPPPPPNLPPPPPVPPPNLPPPPPQQQQPQRRTSTYSSLAEQPPPAPPVLQRSPSYGGGGGGGVPPPPENPAMPRRAATTGGGDMRPPMRSPTQKDRRKVFDMTCSSPQLARQTSAPSRFADDSSFRSSLPPPPVTSSQLLAQQPRDLPSAATANRPARQMTPESPKKTRSLQPELMPPAPAAGESSPVKKSSTEPRLTCGSLGDPRIVARAEKVITQMNELVSIPPTAGEAVLPSKQLIMKAVAGLDLKIKKKQADVKKIQTELEEMVQAEEAAAERAEKERLEEEQRRQDAESKKLEQERKARQEKRLEEHRKKVQAEIDERKRVLDDEQKWAREALDGHIQQVQSEEHLVRTREIQGQIEVAAQAFDRDIAKAQKALEKAKAATSSAEKKMAKVVAEYKHSKENEVAPPPDLAREQERESPEMRAMIARIQAENKRRAQQAQLDSLFLLPHHPNAGNDSNVKTNEQWTNEARQVTGLANALYTEPSEAPFFEHNNQTHSLIEPIVTEIVRHKQRRLQDKWEQLAEEYVVRKDIYDKTHTVLHKEKHSTPTSHPSIFGSKPAVIGGGSSGRESASVSGGRSTSNPYRRARRGQVGNSGDVVRSEYEQEQIIAELTAKEAMEKRIKHGGSKLPRQVCDLEKELNGQYIRTFEARHVDDPLEESREQKNTNIWSDMEKCIFLDRFLQHPKDFRKIASFLRNKTTKDCIAFYYDSKQTVPYKKALKEFVMRRKKRGDYHVWDATIQASLSVGAVITAGTSESKPLTFSLPESDKTYATRNFHPLNHELLDRVDAATSDVDVDMLSPQREGKSRKRKDAPLFTLDAAQRKLLRTLSNDKSAEEAEETDEGKGDEKMTPVRKAPQKWTAAEKKLFHDTVEKHGKNWAMLSSVISSKNITQIKNYYYDHKKLFGKHRGVGDGEARTSGPGSTDGDSDFAERAGKEMFTAAGGAVPFAAESMRNTVDDLSEQQRAALSSQSLQSAADMWARAQIQQQQQEHQQQLQEQQIQQHLSSQEARRLLHSHQHQQVISSMFPWVTAAQVAQAQAQVHASAALQQQQQQQQHQQSQQQENAGIDWSDQATQMQQLLALRQAGHHHGFAVDPSSHLRSIALAGLAAMNQQALVAGNGMMQQQQIDNTAYQSNEGGLGASQGGGNSEASSSSNAALALGMLAQQSINNGNAYNQGAENQSNEQNDPSDQHQTG